ncbi:MAG: DUF167 domain-containing protein [Austwickia sp.]|nr:MAG: DUF167 domain-containing protein [Austwickia sp.]
MRIAVRVRPGASRTRVGGSYGESSAPALVVAVTARAVGGAATEAVLRAVAEAFGVRRHDVRLVSGATARSKVLEIDGDDAMLAATASRLRER